MAHASMASKGVYPTSCAAASSSSALAIQTVSATSSSAPAASRSPLSAAPSTSHDLEPSKIDEHLWKGAAGQGWTGSASGRNLTAPTGQTFTSMGKGMSRATQHAACRAAQKMILRDLKDRWIEIWFPLDDMWYQAKVIDVEAEPGADGGLSHFVVYPIDQRANTSAVTAAAACQRAQAAVRPPLRRVRGLEALCCAGVAGGERQDE